MVSLTERRLAALPKTPGRCRQSPTTEDTSPLALTCQGYVTTTDEFLHAAQRDGGARPDVRGRDLFLAVLAVSWVRGAAVADESSPTALSTLIRTGWATT